MSESVPGQTENTNQPTWIGIGTVAQQLKVSVETVRRWAKAGLLKEHRPDGTNRVFDTQEVAHLITQKPLTARSAAQYLGVSLAQLKQLEDAGIIRSAGDGPTTRPAGRGSPNGAARIFTTAALDAAQERITHFVQTNQLVGYTSNSQNNLSERPQRGIFNLHDERILGQYSLGAGEGNGQPPHKVPPLPRYKPTPQNVATQKGMSRLILLISALALLLLVITRTSNLAIAVTVTLLASLVSLVALKKYLPQHNSLGTLLFPGASATFAQNAPTGQRGEVLISYHAYQTLHARLKTSAIIITLAAVSILLGLKVLPVIAATLLIPVISLATLAALYALYSLLTLAPRGERIHALKALVRTDPRIAFARYAPTEHTGALKVPYVTYKKLYKAAGISLTALILLIALGLGREIYLARINADQNFKAAERQFNAVLNTLKTGQGSLKEELAKLASQSLQTAPGIDENSLTQRIVSQITASLPQPPTEIVRETTETVVERTIVQTETAQTIQLEGTGQYVVKNNRGVTIFSFGPDSTVTLEEAGLFDSAGAWNIKGVRVTATASELNSLDTILATGLIVTAGNDTLTNERILAAGSGITITDSGANNNLTISTNSSTITLATGTTDTDATAGSVFFAGTNGVIQQDNANFFWDDTNNRLGIGTSAPSYALDVASDINTGTKLRLAGNIILHATGTQNFFAGYQAGQSITSGNQNAFVGYSAGASATSADISTYLGYLAGNLITTGDWNTLIGGYAGEKNTTATDNVFVGLSAGRHITTGGFNTCVGNYACNSWNGVTTGNQNSVLGFQALPGLTTGQNNVSLGIYSGYSNTSGSNNVFLGTQAGYLNTTGNRNTILGVYLNGLNSNITTGSNNIIIGSDMQAPSATASNQLNIGNLIYGTALDGSGSTLSTGNIGIGTASPTAKLGIDVGDSQTDNTYAFSVKGTLAGVAANRQQGITRSGYFSGDAIGGAQALVFGNTASPSIRLIGGASTSNPHIYFNSGELSGTDILLAGQNGVVIKDLNANSSNVGIRLNSVGTGPITFYTSNAEKARIDSTGNVGIGTTAPGAQLEVKRALTATAADQYGLKVTHNVNPNIGAFNNVMYGGYFVVSADTALNSWGASGEARALATFPSFTSMGSANIPTVTGLHVGNSAVSNGSITSQYGVRIENLTSATTNYGLFFNGNPNGGSIASAASTHISIMPGSSGNVGIGTTDPLAQLHVEKSSGAVIMLRNGTSNTTFTHTSAGNFELVTNANILFKTGGAERARIDDNGNFGINTTTAGTSCAKCLAIASSTAPTASITDGIQLFAVDVGGLGHELRVRDEAGNVTTLSPHNFNLFKPAEDYYLPWAYTSERGTEAINVDMYGAIQEIELLSGKHFIYGKDLTSGDTFTPTNLADILSVPAAFQELDIRFAALEERLATLETTSTHLPDPLLAKEGTQPVDGWSSPSSEGETEGVEGSSITSHLSPITSETDLDLNSLIIRTDLTVYGSILADTIETATAFVTHGDATIWGKLLVKGNVDIEGNAKVAGSLTRGNEQIGTLTIPAGTTKLRVEFTEPFLPATRLSSSKSELAGDAPIVTLTPEAELGSFWINERSHTGFTLNIATAPAEDSNATWYALQQNTASSTVRILEQAEATPPAPREPEIPPTGTNLIGAQQTIEQAPETSVPIPEVPPSEV